MAERTPHAGCQRQPLNLDSAVYPFERTREYTRVLIATKLEHMFAAPRSGESTPTACIAGWRARARSSARSVVAAMASSRCGRDLVSRDEERQMRAQRHSLRSELDKLVKSGRNGGGSDGDGAERNCCRHWRV